MTSEILASIDSEIARLKQVRVLLSGDETKQKTSTPTPKRHKLSKAARAKIAAAQKARWAKQKGAAASK